MATLARCQKSLLSAIEREFLRIMDLPLHYDTTANIDICTECGVTIFELHALSYFKGI